MPMNIFNPQAQNQYFIDFSTVGTRDEVIEKLDELAAQIEKASRSGAIDQRTANTVTSQMNTAVTKAKGSASSEEILDNIRGAQSLLGGIGSAAGLIESLVRAAEVVHRFF